MLGSAKAGCAPLCRLTRAPRLDGGAPTRDGARRGGGTRRLQGEPPGRPPRRAGVPGAAADRRLRDRAPARQPDPGLCKSGIATPPIRAGPGAAPANGGAGGGARAARAPRFLFRGRGGCPGAGPAEGGRSPPASVSCGLFCLEYGRECRLRRLVTFPSFSRAARGKFPWFSALFFSRVGSLMGAFTTQHVMFPECACFSFRFL